MKKPDPIEEAHFRIDEHERKLSEIGKIAEGIPALIHGGVATLQAGMDAAMDSKLAKLIAAQAQDVETDRAVVERLDRLIEKISALIEVMRAPTTRAATINLPSGPVTMTVREAR